MKAIRSQIVTAVVSAAIILTSTVTPALATSVSHYSSLPGLVNPGDLFLPPAEMGEFFYAQYTGYYTTDTLRDGNGNRADEITVPFGPGGPRTIDVDISIDTWTVAPMLLWAPDTEILGARYGAAVMVPLSNPAIGAALETQAGFGLEIDDSTFGLADMFVQPLWLQWSVAQADVTFAYGFYAPTGRYEAGATDNIGLGFWSHQFQTAARWKFDDRDSLIAFAALTGEVNHNKQDADLVPGPHMTLNWGLRKELGDQWLELAAIGYDSWQMADDSGSSAAPSDLLTRDQVHAAGFQIGIPRFGIAVKYLREFDAEARFEGEIVTLSFAVPLEPVYRKLRGQD